MLRRTEKLSTGLLDSLLSLLRCLSDIMNQKARLAWELYLKMGTSSDSFSLLQLIANDCYKVLVLLASATGLSGPSRSHRSDLISVWIGTRAKVPGSHPRTGGHRPAVFSIGTSGAQRPLDPNQRTCSVVTGAPPGLGMDSCCTRLTLAVVSDGPLLLRSQSLRCSGEAGPRLRLLGRQERRVRRRLPADPGQQGVQVRLCPAPSSFSRDAFVSSSLLSDLMFVANVTKVTASGGELCC